jgi:histidinol phosphatase-like enzyme
MVCPHAASDLCPCHKPRAGLFTEAAFKWHVDLEKCFVISDKWQDAAAARTVGATSLLVQSPWTGCGHHDLVLPDLATVVERILRWQTTQRILAA